MHEYNVIPIVSTHQRRNLLACSMVSSSSTGSPGDFELTKIYYCSLRRLALLEVSATFTPYVRVLILLVAPVASLGSWKQFLEKNKETDL